MKALLKNLPVRHKLSVIVMATAFFVLFTSYSLFTFNLWQSSRSQLVQSVYTLAQAISVNASASLVFDDPSTAEELLDTFTANNDIQYAAILDDSQQVFAEYGTLDSSSYPAKLLEELSAAQAMALPWHWEFDGNYLLMVHKIMIRDRTVGTLLLKVSLASYQDTVTSWVLFGLAVLIVVLLVGYQLSSRLQLVITRPIEKLVRGMRNVSEGDYESRVAYSANDEFGEMVDGFNSMIHQIKRRDEQLYHAKDLAEQANHAKSRFLATMSHEIRTPMNGVLGMAELLKDTELNEKQSEYVDAIRRSGNNLHNIINDVLDYSKIEAGQLSLEEIQYDLKGLIEELVMLLSEQARTKGLSLDYQISKRLSGMMSGDPLRVRQVVTNLVGNAIKFTHRGSVAINVDTHQSDAVQWLRVEVSDTGPGISEEAQESIFESFSQADSSVTRKYGGTGLGLAICRQLVELMDGRIGVQSVLGVGTTFWFELPMAEHLIADFDGAKQLLSGRRALLLNVDDERLSAVGQQLQQWDVSIDSATSISAVESLVLMAAAKGKAFDLLVVPDHFNGQSIRKLLNSLNQRVGPVKTSFLVVETFETDFDWLPANGQALQVEVGGSWQSAMLDKLNTLLVNRRDNALRASPEPSELPQLSGHVLLVEDNAVNQQVASGLLRLLGCSVETAENGIEAIEKWQQGEYDIILMDIEMPVMDGISATLVIREEERDKCRAKTPIVAVTANAMDGDRELYLNSNMDDYLSKPFSRQGLHEMLLRWLMPADADNQQKLRIAELTQPGRTAEETVLNQQIIDSLSDLEDELGRPLFDGLARTYVKVSGQLLADMDAALGKEDFESLRKAAHSLKSSSGNIGADLVNSLSRKVEMSCHEPRLELLVSMVEELSVQNNLACKHLQELLESSSGLSAQL